MYITLNGKNDFLHKADPTDIRRRIDKKYPGARQGVATAVAAIFPKAAPYIAVGLASDEYFDKKRRERLEKEEAARMQQLDKEQIKQWQQEQAAKEKIEPNWLLPAAILLMSFAG